MILCNVELHKALDSGRIVIEPEPKPRQPSIGESHCPYDTHAVDLTLADEISVPITGVITYDLTKPGQLAESIRRNSDTFTITKDQPYPLKPGKFILARTVERVELPIDHPESVAAGVCLGARIEGKSSRARVGLLVHFTAPTIHPDFRGTLTLEMINLGPADILLWPGMAIAQLIVEEVKGIPFKNPSSFQGQNTAAGLPGK